MLNVLNKLEWFLWRILYSCGIYMVFIYFLQNPKVILTNKEQFNGLGREILSVVNKLGNDVDSLGYFFFVLFFYIASAVIFFFFLLKVSVFMFSYDEGPGPFSKTFIWIKKIVGFRKKEVA